MYVFVIKIIRKFQNLTLEKVAKESNISISYLEKLEKNEKNPTFNVLKDIAKTLNVNVKDLFYSANEFEYVKDLMYSSIEEKGLNDLQTIQYSKILDEIHNLILKII